MFLTAAALGNNRSPEVKRLTNHTYHPCESNRDLEVAGLHPSGFYCTNHGLKSATEQIYFFTRLQM